MDRRSWLWRRKSSDKSPSKTESSGSLSSQSERFYDEQAYANNSTQSPEVTSKIAPGDDDLQNSTKLADKLSAALLNISAKEDLVKQHAKVAEEAVSGWEKAENEVVSLKQQLETMTQKNSALEARVSHLDGALKECVRQLRQAREEKEQKIHDIVAMQTFEWESTKSLLETQITELQGRLEIAKTKDAAAGPDLRPKLEAAEKEISDLKVKLLSQAEELELRAIERDLSTQAAETASKQHLESIKKVARLESELRRLRALARKIPIANDHKSCTASSTYVESFTDSQSDCGEQLLIVDADSNKMSGLEAYECETGHSDSWASALIAELDQFKNGNPSGRSFMVPSVEMNLMDDFLEMEKLAVTESRSCCLASATEPGQPSSSEIPLKAELDATIRRSADLEEKLEKVEEDKVKLAMALSECEGHLKTSVDCLNEAELKLVELQTLLAIANEMKSVAEGELEAASAEREVVESKLSVLEFENKSLLSRVGALEEEVAKEKALSAESAKNCCKLEDEIEDGALKIKQEKALAVAATKLAECQHTIASLGQQLKSLATMDDFLINSDKPLNDSSSSNVDSETSRVALSLNGCRDGKLMLLANPGAVPGKPRNGFVKLFSRNKDSQQLGQGLRI